MRGGPSRPAWRRRAVPTATGLPGENRGLGAPTEVSVDADVWRARAELVVAGRRRCARPRDGVAPESRSTTKKRSKKKKEVEGAAPTLLAETSGVPSAARSEVPPEGPRAAATSLGDGVVRPVFARFDWASLLKRVYLEDVLACPCGGRRRVLGDITQPEVITAILTALKLPTEAPPIARARDPAELEAA
jgi:hypothetical protein